MVVKKSITQKDSLGCGIACVAFILDKNYTDTKKYFKGLGDVNKTGYLCRDLVRVLAKKDLNYDYHYLKRRITFKEGTIVFIKRSKRYPVGHYLVKAKNGWMDPWINFDSQSFDLKKAKSGFRKKLSGKAIYAITPIQ